MQHAMCLNSVRYGTLNFLNDIVVLVAPISGVLRKGSSIEIYRVGV